MASRMDSILLSGFSDDITETSMANAPLASFRPNVTPYNYVQNNPLNRIDPYGLTDYRVKGKGKKTINDGVDQTIDVSRGQYRRALRKHNRENGSYDRYVGKLKSRYGYETTGVSDDRLKGVPGVWANGSETIYHLPENPTFSNISNPDRYSGISMYRTRYVLDRTAVCLPGVGIFIHPDRKGKDRVKVLQHEYGHFLDAKYNLSLNINSVGYTNFYLMVGIPSLLTSTGFFGDHKSYSYEIRANKWAEWYFGNNYISDEENYPTQ